MRITAIVLRYKSNWIPLKYLRHEQDTFFGNEITLLQKDKLLTESNILLALSPKIDEEGILLVGDRLEQAFIPYAQKHPIILSSNSNLSRLIIREAHYASRLRSLGWITPARFWFVQEAADVRRLKRAIAFVCMSTKAVHLEVVPDLIESNCGLSCRTCCRVSGNFGMRIISFNCSNDESGQFDA